MRCLYPVCPNTSRTRGLCHGHYQTMRARVRKLATKAEQHAFEDDLEERGLMTPFGSGGTPASDTLGAFLPGSSVKGYGTKRG